MIDGKNRFHITNIEKLCAHANNAFGISLVMLCIKEIGANVECSVTLHGAALPDKGRIKLTCEENGDYISTDSFITLISVYGVARLRCSSDQATISESEAFFININAFHKLSLTVGTYIILLASLSFFLDWPVFTHERMRPMLSAELLKEELKTGHRVFESLIYNKTIERKITNEVFTLIDQLVYELDNDRNGRDLMLYGIYARINDQLGASNDYKTSILNFRENKSLELFYQIVLFLHQNKSHLSRTELERRFNYSANYINRLFIKYARKSIIHYNNTVCIRAAGEMMVSTNMTTEEIIRKLGLTNRTDFYKQFLAEYGVTPKQYRKSII